MGSIPPKKLAEITRDVADEAAFESGRVEDLRAEVLKAYRTVERRIVRSGLDSEQASAMMLRRIREQVSKAGREMESLPPSQEKPTPEQIETALAVFTVEQWITIIDGLDQAGVQAVLSYIRQDTDELKQKHGARKVERIEGRAIMRDTDLWLRDNRSTLVPISDVYWANVWPELARDANRKGKGHPTKGRSVAEQTSDRSIAERLSKRDAATGREMKVSRYEVKRWREHMERLPYDSGLR